MSNGRKISITKPLDWSNSLTLAESIKQVVLSKNEDGDLEATPVIILDPTTKQVLAPSQPKSPTVFAGASGQDTFTAWTPTAGKKFRLMGFSILFSAPQKAAAGLGGITLRDGAGGAQIWQTQFWCVLLASAQQGVSGTTVNFPGNGYLSSTANNILEVAFGSAINGGGVTVSCWGTEEDP